MSSRIGNIVLLTALFATTGCDLDLANPNGQPEEAVLNSPDGIVSLAVGMQGQYASSVADFIRASALVTDEWGSSTAALLNYQVLVTGTGLDRTYATIDAPFSSAYRVIRSANDLVAHAQAVGLDAGTGQAIVALAKLFKGMALGVAIQHFEEVPLDVSVQGPVPQAREVVLDTVLALLESARAEYAAIPTGELATFNGRVLGTGFDVANTINAMLARFYLMDGQHQKAIEAADRVSPTVRSVFSFSSVNVNPIYNISVGIKYVAALKSFADAAEAGDQRVAYWVDTGAPSFKGVPDSVLVPLRQYQNRGDAFPVYLPDEMKLIKAEAYAQTDNLPMARTLINEVRTQSSAVNEPAANLPALSDLQLDTKDRILEQVAYERRYELYMQGLRWEDARRLGEALTTTLHTRFLPLPQQECLANPAQPCNNS